MNPNVTTQYAQQDILTLIGFLSRVNPKFEVHKSQILSSNEISTLEEVFIEFLQLETPSLTPPASA